MLKNYFKTLLIALTLLFGIGANMQAQLVTSVTIDQTPPTIAVGLSTTLTVTVLPPTAAISTVTWTSSDITVATVGSTTGLVTAVGEGTATITATADDASGEFDDIVVTVIIPVTGITLSQTAIALEVTETEALTATAAPSNATDQTVIWSSDDTSIATVDPATGVVTAVGVGSANITATANDGSGVNAVCAVTVNPTPATGVTLPATLKLAVDQIYQLVATVLPANATDKTILLWETSDATVVDVDPLTGEVEALKLGTAKITATTNDGGFKATITVSVVTFVSSITINHEELVLYVTGSGLLTATVLPDTATDKSIKWSSSNNRVAIVSADGVVTGVGVGTAVITATAEDGSGVVATCLLTINELPRPEINRVVIMPQVEGIGTSPGAGSHSLQSSTDFEFEMWPLAGYNLSNVVVTTDRDNAVVIAPVAGATDGRVLVTVKLVNTTTTIKISNAGIGSAVEQISKFSVYPNPTADVVTIAGVTPGSSIQLYSVAGTQVGAYTAETEIVTIDLSSLTGGLYFLNIEGQTLKVMRK